MNNLNPESERMDEPATGPESGDDPANGPDGGSGPRGRTAPERGDEIGVLQGERDALKEQLLRLQADFANYQKRAKQQADEVRTFAVGNLAQDVLGGIDNLERAIDALRSSANQGISAGLDMVQKQLLGILAKYGVEPIPALGEPFDPHYHEALLQQPSDQHPEGTVVAELGKGYKIHDRVLRPSKVAVSVRP